MTDAREAAARAILAKVPDGYGMTMHEALGYVDAVLSTAVPADVEAVCARDVGDVSGAPEWIRVAREHGDQGFWTCAAATEQGPMYVRADLYRAQAVHLAEAGRERDNAIVRAARQEDRAEAAEAESARLREALKPFSEMAGELFARNWNRSDMVLALDNPDDPHRLMAGDFFEARAALNGGQP